MSDLRATLRLQLHKGFTLHDATALVPYMAQLGISHLYASPVLTARPGSMHGYDVIDPSQVNPELGGEAALVQLADALHDDYPGADCLVLNMVLHHFAAPAEALQQLAQRLKPGGSLLLSELGSHNQSWAREACGDLWLGFEQDDLARWAIGAGLTPSESLYVGLKNGFQIQIRHFAKPQTFSGPSVAFTDQPEDPKR